MNQWIGAVNSYYYPYMIYLVGHERNVFPKLGIEPDEKVVAHALPKIEIGLQVVERQLADGRPTTPKIATLRQWLLAEAEEDARRLATATTREGGAAQPPYGPIEHARKWAVSHRPKY